jgi:hypothetical protein
MDQLILLPLQLSNGVEVVARKGLGHPDTICDALAAFGGVVILAPIEITFRVVEPRLALSATRFQSQRSPSRARSGLLASKAPSVALLISLDGSFVS